MHNNSLELFINHGLPIIQPGQQVLEIGPDWSVDGGRCHQQIRDKGANYHFADLKNTREHTPGFLRMDGPYSLLCNNDEFDVVFSLNVAEHVAKLWQWVGELKRIAKPRGHIIFINPVSWPYHPSPLDCWRILPDGYKALFEDTGLEYEFGWHGNLVPLEHDLQAEHGPSPVTDTIAIARKPL